MSQSNTFTITIQAAGATSLENIILNQMTPNSWRDFTPAWPGGVSAFFSPGGSESIVNWTHVGFYDQTNKKARFIGAGYGVARLVTYDLATDAWSAADFNGHGNGVNAHIWDASAYDASRNTLFYAQSLAVLLNSLSQSSANPGAAVADGQMGTEFFPEIDAVVYADRNGNVTRRPVGGSLTSFGTWPRTTDNGYHNFISYNPVRGVIYGGGGHLTGGKFWEMNASGVATELSSSDAFGGIDCTREHAACGHISGDLVVIDNRAGTVFRYKHGSGWASVATAFPSDLIGAGAQSTMIPLRIAGAEAFLSFLSTGNIATSVKCYIYRYS